MHIILTHEQADFDALASMLGAYLIEERSIPVLPRKLNRNVRAFLTLYGDDLPFLDPRDLGAEIILSITLVDTQSLTSLRGMNEKTHVRVIDHHPLRDDLPPDWMITVSGTGANTTLFVETLRERECALNMLQATLLLIGIYEDTGSLTYERTTARDLRAASFLLEQGASLQIASGFLNHPLSHAQHEIYRVLRDNTETHIIQGYTILVSTADASANDEELSTIVHKLRDYFDPDAIIVCVKTRSGVQLIARSSTSNIDVGQLALFLGGGGHERAAACLIKDRSLEAVRQQVLVKLAEYIQPSVQVAQIMSNNPQLLSPGASVQEAARRMQRYGYEGFPVVQDNRLLGLLTRRAVDRAISHKLFNARVDSLMEAGNHTVKPTDSIDHLQRLMTETGWGQIPVIDPAQGKIIGIVTRTDLIKVLTPRQHRVSQLNLTERLDRLIPNFLLRLLKAIAEIAYQQHVALYVVGGFVRDLLLEHPSLDFDLVVEGDAISLANQVMRRYGGRVVSHTRFGTAKWLPSEGQVNGDGSPGSGITWLGAVDLVSARTEFYTHPSALPTVERGSIKLDLHRRDFTINTLAMRLDGRHYGDLYDYWGGLADLKRGIVRVLHSLSFVDDPTRMLRAVRFEQRFSFAIDKRTQELLGEALSLLDRVSGDRIRHEIDSILKENKSSAMLARLSQLGLLSAIHPDLIWDGWLEEKMARMAADIPAPQWGFSKKFNGSIEQRHGIYCLWLLRLTLVQARAVIARLKLSAGLARLIEETIGLWQELSSFQNARPSRVVESLEEIHRLALYAVYVACDEEPISEVIFRFVTYWSKIRPITSGRDLEEMGVPPGPAYREILKALRDGWLNETITTRLQEKAMLDKLLAIKLA
jgi:tRNA nucleotidyltransferase (CCA-adding enzyme)